MRITDLRKHCTAIRVEESVKVGSCLLVMVVIMFILVWFQSFLFYYPYYEFAGFSIGSLRIPMLWFCYFLAVQIRYLWNIYCNRYI